MTIKKLYQAYIQIAFLIITTSHEVKSQNDSYKTFTFLYELPDIKPTQFSKVMVQMNYKLSLEKISENKYKVWAKYTFVPTNTKITTENVGEYNYKYKGKWYNSDEMWYVDPRTEDGFMNTYGFVPDVKITMVSMTGKILENTDALFFGHVSDNINTNNAFVGYISKPEDINTIIISPVNTKVYYVNTTGTDKLHERINNYEKKISHNKTFQAALSKANMAYNNKEYSKAKEYYQEALNVYPKNYHSRRRLKEIDEILKEHN